METADKKTVQNNGNANLIVPIHGKIEKVYTYESRTGRRVGHIITCVSQGEDEFDVRRSRIIVSSDRTIDNKGAVVKIIAELSGSVYENPYTDKDTGERKTFTEFRAYLNEVQP